jgi:puromycin-sensitive aminopeptidase
MAARAPVSGRLPGIVAPVLYTIELTVDPNIPTFSGRVSIDITLQAPARTIALHALELTIQNAEIEAAGKTFAATVTADKESETITLAPSDTIPQGRATITLAFSGTLNQQLRGLYQTRATVDGREERYVFTQCEATDARRIFPCFDEPALKARFRLTAIIPARLSALSNMPVESVTDDGAMRRVRFEETPVMSTYLFALAVAQFEEKSVMVDGCRLAVVTLPGQLRYADFALEVGRAGLSLLNRYFGLHYPLAKLDLVALPNFAMGAMENWGAVFFRDSRLLVDDSLASTATKRIVANVIVHEIVHQWFGNLVTMVWWDDLWLNEAFATWLAVKIVDQWRPEWNSWVEFQQAKQYPLAIDSLSTTRPIVARVTSAAQIEELFDPLTYEKGAAVLRMIEQFLGETAFRDGIRRYITAHQHGNATAAALWEALEAASGQPVGAIARDWFAQPGYPVVTLTPVAGTARTIQIEQRRFHAQPSTAVAAPSESSPQQWMILLILSFHDRAGLRTHRLLLQKLTETVELPGAGAIDWLYGNAGESGFYRCRVEAPFQEALRTGALSQLDPAERIGLLDHLWALSQNGTIPIREFLDAMMACRGDRTRVVVQALTGYLETLMFYLSPTDQQPRIADLARELLAPLWTQFGWGPVTGEDDEIKLARASCLWGLGRIAGDRPFIQEATARFEQALTDPTSIDPTLATSLARLRAATGNAETFQQFVDLFIRAETPEARDRFLLALADFSDPQLARRYLELSLTDRIRSQDAWKPMRYLLAQAAHPPVQAEAWAFMKSRWGQLRKKTGSVGALRMIAGLRHVWRPDWHDEVRRFFGDPENRVDAAERALAQTLEFIQIGIVFKERQQASLTQWLNTRQ